MTECFAYYIPSMGAILLISLLRQFRSHWLAIMRNAGARIAIRIVRMALRNVGSCSPFSGTAPRGKRGLRIINWYVQYVIVQVVWLWLYENRCCMISCPLQPRLGTRIWNLGLFPKSTFEHMCVIHRLYKPRPLDQPNPTAIRLSL